MGTNYYIEKPRYHIGKSSGGWCFSLHVDPENGIKYLRDIEHLWKGKIIKDEYSRTVSKKEMLAIITQRSWNRNSILYRYPGWDGLLRHKIEGNHCIGHNDGTYDYIIGKFS